MSASGGLLQCIHVHRMTYTYNVWDAVTALNVSHVHICSLHKLSGMVYLGRSLCH